ncbi:MAG: class I SAM-dependent methyltransferase [Saprospirales bacterium]|nr:class I SAM-dependent methyltransferase [Saprospirales bacterium]
MRQWPDHGIPVIGVQRHLSRSGYFRRGHKNANERVGAPNAKLRFSIANINDLKLPEGGYDLLISLDTLYYADSLPGLLEQAGNLLSNGGRLMAYFSQWIMDEAYAENLLPDNTHLAKALASLGLKYTFHNLTDSGLRHWKKKLAVLEDMREAFAKEGNTALWDYRYREAYRYANWGNKKYSRYFYEVKF